MMKCTPVLPEDLLRSAIESGDYAGANAALNDYMKWFKSAPRTAGEIERVRTLLDWAVRATCAGKVKLAGEMSFVAASADDGTPAANATDM
jgi:hypothetical protein